MAKLSDDKENQHPSIPASEPTAIQDQPKKHGRSKDSKNKTKNSITPVSPNTTQVKQSKKTIFELQTAITPGQVKTPCPHTRYSDADNKILIGVFLDQKAKGNNTDNGGWKGKAITEAVKALEESELKSSGAPKSIGSIQDHWDQVCIILTVASTLLIIILLAQG